MLELAGKNGYRTTSELKASLECDYLNYRVITTSAGTHADGRAGLPSQPLQQTTVFQLSSLTSPLRLQLMGRVGGRRKGFPYAKAKSIMQHDLGEGKINSAKNQMKKVKLNKQCK